MQHVLSRSLLPAGDGSDGSWPVLPPDPEPSPESWVVIVGRIALSGGGR